jgi:lipoate-protein ligase A
MIGYLSTSQDAAFNLATEEYLLKHRTENLFFLYMDNPAVVVGKHQNALSEINYQAVKERNIPVFRRLSGGGTVYHDAGNLNFCFITSGTEGKLIDFKHYTSSIIAALNALGVPANFGGRNDLLIDTKKISGNASHVFKNRVMHHGTLLLNSDLPTLNAILKTDPAKYRDQAVKSVRSRVTNISEHLKAPMDINEFRDYLFETLRGNDLKLSLTQEELDAIQKINTEKYSTWEWNFGYSPDYTLNRRFKWKDHRLEVVIGVKRGIVQSAEVLTQTRKELFELFFNHSIGQPHAFDTFQKIAQTISPELNQEDLLFQLF